MFNKLKEKAQAQAIEKIQSIVGPELMQQVENFKSLKPADVQDNDKFSAVAVKPLLTTLKASSGGAISLAEKAGIKIEDRLTKAMLHVRDELISVDGDKVKLDADFNNKVGPTLLEALKQK